MVPLDGRAVIWVQGSFELSWNAPPQPDLAVLSYRPDFYDVRVPLASDVLLAIEVADSSLTYDRDLKLPRYAAAGIGESWLVNLTDSPKIASKFTATRV